MTNYEDGRDDPLYREGGGLGQEDQTAVQQPYQQGHQQQPYQQQRFGPPGGQGYGPQAQPGMGHSPYVQGGMPYGYGPWMRPRRQYPIETKPFFLTSEFVAAVLAVLGIAITAASSDAFGAWRAWILITAVIVGYMVARGIAKSGTRSHSADPRENLDFGNWGRGDSGD